MPYAEGTILIYNVKGAAGGRMDGATVTPSNLSTSSSMRAAWSAVRRAAGSLRSSPSRTGSSNPDFAGTGGFLAASALRTVSGSESG